MQGMQQEQGMPPGMGGMQQQMGDLNFNDGNDSNEAPPDAVLVFLSGTKEIESMMETLLRRPQFASPQCAQWVLALHGGLPPDEQRKVCLGRVRAEVACGVWL